MKRAIDGEIEAEEHPTWSQLMQFAIGKLEAHQTTSMERHIAECDTCCQKLESAPEDRLTQLLRKSPIVRRSPGLRLVAGYEILDELGRGGMGVVYRAVQPALNRLVAIKMIGHLVHASQQELARFRLEAQTCAALNHPNIAQVYDVGEMDGQPYIAMELVCGDTLSEFLLKRTLKFEEAVSLLIALAQAMQHAHTCGIVHRDLKPSNIILEDGGNKVSNLTQLWPKIVDFGLAKRIETSAGVTSIGNIIGTPSYMSPELAVGDQSLVGPPTDIYSLGAILYEALVGRPPFKGANAVETLSQVQKDEPAKPSTLRPGFPRDLETICLKCLEKLPSNRYLSAVDLLEDLSRFQHGRPILAKPASMGSRALKWSKRHPTLVALMGFSVFTLVGMLALGLNYNASLRNALSVAETERSRANQNFQVSFQAVEQMLDRVGFAHLADTPEMEDVREKLLADAVDFYSKLMVDQPEADVQSRRLYYGAMSRLGRIRGALGHKEAALKTLGEAIDLQLRLSMENPDRYELRHDLASSYINQGQVSNDADDYSAAIQILQHIADDYPSCRMDLAQALNNLAVVTPSMEEREQLHLRAKVLRVELLATSPDDHKLLYGMAETLHNLAYLYMTTGRSQESEDSYGKALKIFEHLVNSQNSVTDYHRALAECLTHMAAMLHSFGRSEEAIAMIQRGTETRRVLAARFPKLPSMKEAVIRGLLTEATFHIGVSRFEFASKLSEQAVEMAMRLTDEFPTSEQRFIEASCLTILATSLSGDSQLSAARSAFERANTIYDELLDTDPGSIQYKIEAGVQFMNYSNILRSENPQLAAEFNDRSVALLEEAYTKFPQRTDVESYLFNAHGARASTYDALSHYCESVVSWNRAVELAPLDRQITVELLRALALARCGDNDMATQAANALFHAKNTSAVDLYNIACVFGLLHQSSQKRTDSNPTEILDNNYSERAIELLCRDATIDFLQNPNNLQQLMLDTDLESVRASPSFSKLSKRLSLVD